MTKESILQLLNHALELEHAAYVQYLSHAEVVDGINAEPIIARLKEIAGDELKHQEKFRTLIGALGGVPSMGIAATYPAKDVKGILEQNLKNEKEAVDTYRGILEALKKEKWQGYYDHLLEHEVRHILMEEQEHITELELLLGIQGSSY
ncbi:MAG: ferritin-like domain-containing protein [Candidatus Freyarchaeota archaeon]|nr:ferritin-like domain-containing protein [Candidatus Jordarchaeia archaeon]MBS7279799.1 ferritin-like domain-containing protein [Candidatus Jordarchaeia archaeon]